MRSAGSRLCRVYLGRDKGADVLPVRDAAAHAADGGGAAQTFARMEAKAPDAWPCWAYSNHDVIRHVTPLGPVGRRRPRLYGAACHPARVLVPVSGRGAGACLKPRSRSRPCRIPTASASGPNSRAATVAARRWSGYPTTGNGGFTGAAKPWLPVDARHLGRAVAAQEGDAGSMLEHYRRAWPSPCPQHPADRRHDGHRGRRRRWRASFAGARR